MYSQIITIAAMTVAMTQAGLIYNHALQPVGIEYTNPDAPIVNPHPAVEINAANDALLPRELLKSRDFYDNPSIAAGLAKESWFANKEMVVTHREAERIPRERIYHIVKNAGFLDANKGLLH